MKEFVTSNVETAADKCANVVVCNAAGSIGQIKIRGTRFGPI